MKRFIAAALIASLGIGTVAPAALAKANEKNAPNLAIGSTAAAAYLLSQKKSRTLGLVVAGSSAYAWKKHHDAVKQRHDRARRLANIRSKRLASIRAKRLAYNRAHPRAYTVRTSHAR
jgi:hypothetical protein